MTDMKFKKCLEINGENIDLQLFAESNNDDFLKSNKKTTASYRAAMAKAIGITGTIPIITKMAFGIDGETDEQGNPAPPKDDGPLNNVVFVKDIGNVTYPSSTTVCFETIIEMGELTAVINEVALIDADNNTAAKMRLLTPKGTDAESGLVFRWYVEF